MVSHLPSPSARIVNREEFLRVLAKEPGWTLIGGEYAVPVFRTFSSARPEGVQFNAYERADRIDVFRLDRSMRFVVNVLHGAVTSVEVYSSKDIRAFVFTPLTAESSDRRRKEAIFGRWLSDGKSWVGVFQNIELGHPEGGSKIAFCYDAAQFDAAKINETQAPDGQHGLGWRYRLVAKCRTVLEAMEAMEEKPL